MKKDTFKLIQNANLNKVSQRQSKILYINIPNDNFNLVLRLKVRFSKVLESSAINLKGTPL